MPVPSNFVSQYDLSQGRQVTTRFTYANAADRLNDVRAAGPASMAAEALGANDIGSISHQLDDDTFWFLIGVGPIDWVQLDSGEGSVVDVEVRKATAGTINKGQAVYFDSWDAGLDIPLVELAQSDSASTMPSFGLALTSITDSLTGVVRMIGIIDGLDTSTPGWSLGDTLFVSNTVAGGLQNTRPTGGSTLIQDIGIVGQIDLTDGNLGVSGAKRANDLPNLTQGNLWIGDASGHPVEVSSGALVGLAGNEWAFSTTTAMADPGSATFRVNNASQNLATEIAISSTSASGVDLSPILAALKSGDYLYAEQDADSTRFNFYQVSGAATDNGTWVQVPVTFDNGGSALQDGFGCTLVVFTGASGGVTAHSALTGLTVGDDHTQYQLRSEQDAASGYVGLTAGSKISSGAFQVYGTTGNTACEGNDGRLPTTDQKAALAGTGTPSGANVYVTDDDARLDGSGILHSALSNLTVGDDHTQYHNDSRGDIRYYQKAEFINTSAGAADSGKPVVLDASGHVDATMVNSADVDHNATQNLATGDFHTQYHNDARGDIRYYQKTEHINSSAGVGDAGKPIVLNASGLVDETMLPAEESPPGYVDGLVVRWTSITQLTIDAGIARDDTDDLDLILGSPTVVDITVTGAGGREAADAEDANSWYYVWLIGDSSETNPTSTFMSKTASPTLPAGYDRKRLRILARNHSGDLFEYRVIAKGARTSVYYDEDRNSAPQRITASGGATSWSTVNGSIVLPPIAHIATINVQQTSGSISTALRPNGFSDTGGPVLVRPNGSDNFQMPIFDQQLQYQNTGFGGSTTIDVGGYEADF